MGFLYLPEFRKLIISSKSYHWLLRIKSSATTFQKSSKSFVKYFIYFRRLATYILQSVNKIYRQYIKFITFSMLPKCGIVRSQSHHDQQSTDMVRPHSSRSQDVIIAISLYHFTLLVAITSSLARWSYFRQFRPFLAQA
jgi:hypothetical protein